MRKLGGSSTGSGSLMRSALDRAPAYVLRRLAPRPVATTVTHTCPVSDSSTVAPKMICVSSVAACLITSAASFTSISERSSPPAIESRMPRAPVSSVSISGERSARSAASRARLS